MRILRTCLRAALALAAVTCTAALSVESAPSPGPAGAVSVVGTPLPPGWELCILQGVSAPATAANIADLDEWQAVEGGSTNNTAAFNPYNTRRTTDRSGAPLPLTLSSNGFPAFDNWLAGCAATVATLLQQNMWAIDVTLDAGGVMPATSFLATVDQTQWCAPSNGQPCYIDEITGGSSAVRAVPAVLTASSALQVYGNVNADLRAYQLSLVALSSDQSAQATRSQALVAADAAVTTAREAYEVLQRRLGTFGVAEYVTGKMFEGSDFLGGTNASTQDAQSAAANQYADVTANGLVTRAHAAAETVGHAEATRTDIAHRLAQASAAVLADTAAENRALVMLMADVDMLQTAGACTAVPAVATPAADSSTGAVGGNNPTDASTTTSTTPPSTGSRGPSVLGSPGDGTTTTTVPPADGAPTTSTTTSTSPTTTTTGVQPAPPPGGDSSTTTTSPSPGATSTPTESANPGGITSLQGCVAGFAPTPST